jgi:hypothetical protein
MRKTKLILHLGVHRTGSTSIQNCLAESRGIIRTHGYLYPKLFGEWNHVSIPWKIKSNKISSMALVNEIERNMDELTHTIILSAEDFCILQDPELFECLETIFDVTVVVYLKEQVKWLESWYNQNIRWPWNKKFSSASPEYFLSSLKDFYWIDYDALLRMLSDIFGENNIKVNLADKFGVKDTVSDFLKITGIDHRWLNKYTALNESTSKNKIDLLRKIDILGLPDGKKRAILKAIDEIDFGIYTNDSKAVFDEDQVLFIKNCFASGNEFVASRFFDRDKLFFEEDYSGRHVTTVPDEYIYKELFPQLIKLVF